MCVFVACGHKSLMGQCDKVVHVRVYVNVFVFVLNVCGASLLI